jgi:hypothetical protein
LKREKNNVLTVLVQNKSLLTNKRNNRKNFLIPSFCSLMRRIKTLENSWKETEWMMMLYKTSLILGCLLHCFLYFSNMMDLWDYKLAIIKWWLVTKHIIIYFVASKYMNVTSKEDTHVSNTWVILIFKKNNFL